MTKKLLPIVILFLLTGCGSKIHIDDGISLKNRLLRNEGVLIGVPEDALFDGKPYPSSGVQVADQIRLAVERYTEKLALRQVREIKKFNQFDISSYSYYFKPTIIHYEDRVPQNPTPDMIKISLEIIELNSQKIIAQRTIKVTGMSGITVIASNKQPYLLLRWPLLRYMKEIYQHDK